MSLSWVRVADIFPLSGESLSPGSLVASRLGSSSFSPPDPGLAVGVLIAVHQEGNLFTIVPRSALVLWSDGFTPFELPTG